MVGVFGGMVCKNGIMCVCCFVFFDVLGVLIYFFVCEGIRW